MAKNLPIDVRLTKLQNWIEEELVNDPRLMSVDKAYEHYEFILRNTRTMFDLGLRSANNDYIFYARNLLKTIKVEMKEVISELEINSVIEESEPEEVIHYNVIPDIATWLHTFFNKHKTKKTVQAAIKGYTQSIDVYITVSKCYDEMSSLDITSINNLLSSKEPQFIADLQTLI